MATPILDAQLQHRIDELRAKVARGEELSLEEQRAANDALRASRMSAAQGRTAQRAAKAAPDGRALLDAFLTTDSQ